MFLTKQVVYVLVYWKFILFYKISTPEEYFYSFKDEALKPDQNQDQLVPGDGTRHLLLVCYRDEMLSRQQ